MPKPTAARLPDPASDRHVHERAHHPIVEMAARGARARLPCLRAHGLLSFLYEENEWRGGKAIFGAV